MKWVEIKSSTESGESYLRGLRAVSLANDGTLTEVSMGFWSARISVTLPSFVASGG